MPQMNPMNWIIIFLVMNVTFMGVLVKVHFLGKTPDMVDLVEIKQDGAVGFKLMI